MYRDTLLFELPVTALHGREFTQVFPDCAYLQGQREAMGLSQSEAAEAAGIKLRQYQRLEDGTQTMMSASLRIGLAVCDVLQLDPHRFVPRLPTK